MVVSCHRAVYLFYCNDPNRLQTPESQIYEADKVQGTPRAAPCPSPNRHKSAKADQRRKQSVRSHKACDQATESFSEKADGNGWFMRFYGIWIIPNDESISKGHITFKTHYKVVGPYDALRNYVWDIISFSGIQWYSGKPTGGSNQRIHSSRIYCSTYLVSWREKVGYLGATGACMCIVDSMGCWTRNWEYSVQLSNQWLA